MRGRSQGETRREIAPAGDIQWMPMPPITKAIPGVCLTDMTVGGQTNFADRTQLSSVGAADEDSACGAIASVIGAGAFLGALRFAFLAVFFAAFFAPPFDFSGAAFLAFLAFVFFAFLDVLRAFEVFLAITRFPFEAFKITLRDSRLSIPTPRSEISYWTYSQRVLVRSQRELAPRA